MNKNIVSTTKLERAGRKGMQRWRIRYRFEGDQRWQSQYFGRAEGSGRLTKREADRLAARWLVEVGRDPGKAGACQVPTLKAHIDRYKAAIEPRYSQQSIDGIGLTIRYLLAYFGDRRRVSAISAPDAQQWATTLVTGGIGPIVAQYEGKPNRCKADGMSDASMKTHTSNARHIFAKTVQWHPDTMRMNPFDVVRIKVKPGKGVWRYVPHDDAVAAIEACTDQYTSRIGWQVFIALQRFAGLRRGEALALEKADVDVSSDPMIIKVYASKTARSTGVPSRVVPVLYPVLADLLVAAIGETDPADRLVVSSAVTRHKGSQHKTLGRILKRAGLDRWRPGFQVLRACTERDFLDFGLSEFRYARAIGHSPEVSRRYYLARFEGAVVDEHATDEFKAAAGRAAALYPAATRQPVERTATERQPRTFSQK